MHYHPPCAPQQPRCHLRSLARTSGTYGIADSRAPPEARRRRVASHLFLGNFAAAEPSDEAGEHGVPNGTRTRRGGAQHRVLAKHFESDARLHGVCTLRSAGRADRRSDDPKRRMARAFLSRASEHRLREARESHPAMRIRRAARLAWRCPAMPPSRTESTDRGVADSASSPQEGIGKRKPLFGTAGK